MLYGMRMRHSWDVQIQDGRMWRLLSPECLISHWKTRIKIYSFIILWSCNIPPKRSLCRIQKINRSIPYGKKTELSATVLESENTNLKQTNLVERRTSNSNFVSSNLKLGPLCSFPHPWLDNMLSTSASGGQITVCLQRKGRISQNSIKIASKVIE